MTYFLFFGVKNFFVWRKKKYFFLKKVRVFLFSQTHWSLNRAATADIFLGEMVVSCLQRSKENYQFRLIILVVRLWLQSPLLIMQHFRIDLSSKDTNWWYIKWWKPWLFICQCHKWWSEAAIICLCCNSNFVIELTKQASFFHRFCNGATLGER